MRANNPNMRKDNLLKTKRLLIPLYMNYDILKVEPIKNAIDTFKIRLNFNGKKQNQYSVVEDLKQISSKIKIRRNLVLANAKDGEKFLQIIHVVM